MAHRHEITQLMRDMNLDENMINDEDFRLYERGGYSITDSENDNESEGRDSLASLHGIEHKLHEKKRSEKSHMHQMLAMKSKYEAMLGMMDREKGALQNDLARQKDYYETEIKRIMAEHQAEHEKTINNLKNLKNASMKLNSQVPLIKESLGKVKEMAQGLIPEETYNRLKKMPDDELHPSEWILVHTWETIQPLRRENESYLKEIQRNREDFKQMQDRHTKVLAELENHQRVIRDKDEEEKRKATVGDNQKKALDMELEKAYDTIESLRGKANKYDDLLVEHRKLKDELSVASNKLALMEDPRQFKEQIVSQIMRDGQSDEELRRKYLLLEKDKGFLTKENMDLADKNRRQEEKIDKLEAEVMDGKRQVNEYLQKLLNSKDNTSLDYERRMNKELMELRDKHNMELEATKSNLIDIYEKQIRFLKENVEETEIKLDNAQSQLKEKNSVYDQLLLENRTIQRRVENDLSEIRLQYRMKTEELERLTNIYEETNANLKATKLENEMLREKLAALKAEYYKVESSAKQDTADIKAQLAMAREKLNAYEAIEREIDEAIVGLAGGPSDSGNVYMNALNMAPTTTKRRVQQALALAQRLNAKERECEELRHRLAHVDEDRKKVEEELGVARELLGKTNQPYSYLITNLEEKEKELMEIKAKWKRLEQDYQNIKAENQAMKKALEDRNDEINRLLIKRETIAHIQKILLNLVNAERENLKFTDVNKLIQDIQALLNRGDRQGGMPLVDPYETMKGGRGGPTATPPMRDNATGNFGESETKRRDNVPEWYSKLKGKLNK